MKTILDFCGSCGVLLPSQDNLIKENECDNCNLSVLDRRDRIQGEFSINECNKLFDLHGYEELSIHEIESG